MLKMILLSFLGSLTVSVAAANTPNTPIEPWDAKCFFGESLVGDDAHPLKEASEPDVTDTGTVQFLSLNNQQVDAEVVIIQLEGIPPQISVDFRIDTNGDQKIDEKDYGVWHISKVLKEDRYYISPQLEVEDKEYHISCEW